MNSIRSKLVKSIFTFMSVVSLTLAIFNIDTYAAETIPTVNATSNTSYTTEYTNDDWKYKFSYTIGDTSKSGSNTSDSNTAVISTADYTGTKTSGVNFTIPQYVKVKYNSKNYKLTVIQVGTGSSVLDSTDKSKISTITTKANLKTVGNNAFKDCDNITKFVVSGTLETIGTSAFESCDSLSNICYSTSDGTTNNNLKSTLKNIGSKAFYDCKSLVKLTIGNGSQVLQSDTFGGNTPLTTLTINSDTFTSNGAFRGKTTIQTLNFHNTNITSIKNNEFSGCTGLKSITLDGNITSIGSNAFNGCTGLTSIHVGNKVTTIGDSAFKGCTGATKVHLGKKVTTIGNSAFEGCTSLNNIYYINDDEETLNYRLRNSITSIGNKSFYNCTALEKLAIYGTPSLRSDTFGGNTPLKELTIHGNLANHSDAFRGKTTIQKLYFGLNVTVIYDNMFRDCSGLTYVDFKGTKMTDVGAYAFYGCTSLTSKNAFDFTAFDNSLTGTVGKYAFKFGGLNTEGTVAGEPKVSIDHELTELTDYYPTSGIAKVTMTIKAESQQANAGSDYIICMDTTGSMNDFYYCDKCGKTPGSSSTNHATAGCTGTIKNQLDVTKEAACEFVDIVLNDNNSNRIAVVIYYGRGTNSEGTLVVDFTSDKSTIKNKINSLVLSNTNSGAILSTFGGTEDDDGNGTNYKVGIVASAITAQARGGSAQTANSFSFGGKGGANRPINMLFISDGEPTQQINEIAALSKIAKGLFDNIWSIGIAVADSASNPTTALGYLETVSTNLNGKSLFKDISATNMVNELNEHFSSIAEMSKASIYSTRLTSTMYGTNWEFCNESLWSKGLVKSGNQVYVDIGLVSDDIKSYEYYIKIKESYKDKINKSGRHDVLALTTIGTSYKISGGISANKSINTTKNDNDYSYWYAYDIIYHGNNNTSGSTANQLKIGGRDIVLRNNGFVRTGYDFVEWNTSANGSGTGYVEGQTFTENKNLDLYAIWKLAKIKYTVNHFKQNLDGTYDSKPYEVDKLEDTPYIYVTPNTKQYEGFISPSTQTVQLVPEKEIIINYYYVRGQYKVILQVGTGIASVSGDGTYKYEERVNIDAVVKPGYTWKEWQGTPKYNTKATTFIMPARDLTFRAEATPNDDTPYIVNHWLQKVDALSDEENETNYELVETENKIGTTDTKVTPPVKKYENFISPPEITVNINGDGSTVVNYYYRRQRIGLDVDCQYIMELYETTFGYCTFDVYINDRLVADDVTEYKNTDILYGSTWWIDDINIVKDKEYTGSDVTTYTK